MSKSKPAMRDVTIGLRILRDILLGRKHELNLRFAWLVASRSPNPPQLPPGPHSKLSDNYYYTRDGRHLVEQPLVIAGPQRTAQIESSKAAPSSPVLSATDVTPGKPYLWDAVEKDAYNPNKVPKIH